MLLLCIDAKTAEDAVSSMFRNLIDGLPDSLIPALVEKDVVSKPDQELMNEMTRGQKTAYLLNEIVMQLLKEKALTKFESFLEAMEQSEDYTCRSLATDLSTKLGRQVKASFPKIIPPSGNYPYTYVCSYYK